MNKKLLLFFFLAFFIRLISLDQSLWLDEATTAKVVQQYNFLEIITKFSPNDFHPPLYYLFMKLWTNFFGYSEVALRFPSIIFSLMTGFIVYKIAKLLNGYIVGIWAAVFFLFNPLIVYYSQEGRMYMMTTFFLTLALYFCFDLCHVELTSASDSGQDVRRPQARMTNGSRNKFGMTKTLSFTLCLILAFVTFYGSIFLIMPMLLYLLYKKKYREFFVSCFILFATLLLVFPLLFQQFINAKKSLQIVPNWSSVLGKVNIKNLFLIPLKFSIGRISFYPKWVYWGVSGLWTAFIWLFVIKGGLRRKEIMAIIVMTIVSGLIFSFYSPLLQYFRFLYLIPLISILLATEVGVSMYRYIFSLGFIILSFIYLLNPSFHREDWKSLAKALPANKSIYMIYTSSDPVKYYRKNAKIVDLRSLQNPEGEIIVIPYSADIHGVNYQGVLKKKAYFKKETKIFRQLYFEIWQRTSS